MVTMMSQKDECTLKFNFLMYTLKGVPQMFCIPVFWYCRIGYNVLTIIRSLMYGLKSISTETPMYMNFFKEIEQCNRGTFFDSSF